MQLLDTPYSCFFSKLTFSWLFQSLNKEQLGSFIQSDRYIAFIDGDSADIYGVIKYLHQRRKTKNDFYIITLAANVEYLSSGIRHLSDCVVDKKISCEELKKAISTVSMRNPKPIEDDIFGDVVGHMLKSSRNEQRVLALLLEGLSQAEIAKRLHLSIKTISAYKVKAVKKMGAKNFNQLCIRNFRQSLSKA